MLGGQLNERQLIKPNLNWLYTRTGANVLRRPPFEYTFGGGGGDWVPWQLVRRCRINAKLDNEHIHQ